MWPTQWCFGCGRQVKWVARSMDACPCRPDWARLGQNGAVRLSGCQPVPSIPRVSIIPVCNLLMAGSSHFQSLCGIYFPIMSIMQPRQGHLSFSFACPSFVLTVVCAISCSLLQAPGPSAVLSKLSQANVGNGTPANMLWKVFSSVSSHSTQMLAGQQEQAET